MKSLLLFLLFAFGFIFSVSGQETFLGSLSQLSHGVSGEVYAVDDRTIRIRRLNYDGLAPDAYFWVGSTKKPGVTGTALTDEKGSRKPLKSYRNADVLLKLPAGKTLRDIKHIGLWCRKFQVDFGHVNLI